MQIFLVFFISLGQPYSEADRASMAKNYQISLFLSVNGLLLCFLFPHLMRGLFLGSYAGLNPAYGSALGLFACRSRRITPQPLNRYNQFYFHFV